MSAYDAEPTGEVKNDSDEPIQGHNGVDYGSYASEGNIEKATNVDMNFDSKDYERRQHNSLLVNVEGADRIKREEERRKLEADRARIDEINRLSAEKSNGTNGTSAADNDEKALRRAIKQKQRADRLQEKKAKSTSALRRLLHNKKAMVIIIVALIAIAAGIFLAVRSYIAEAPKREMEQKEKDYSAAVADAESIESRFLDESNDFSYDDALEAYQSLVDSSQSDTSRIENTIRYEKFILEYSEDYAKAEELLLSIEEYVARNPELYPRYYSEFCELYRVSGNEEKFNEYHKKKVDYEGQEN